MRSLLVAAIASLVITGLLPGCDTERDPAAAGVETIDVDRIRAHIDFLASDLLEGRETGERGYNIAAEYVATQCRLLGLEPAGVDGTYFQPVRFRESTFVDGDATITVDGATSALAIPDDIAISGSYGAKEETVSGDVVFVGWGISAPEFGYDDYANVDVEGRIVMMVRRGAPESFPSEVRAYYTSSSYKMSEAIARGARGVLLVSTPEYQERISWERLKSYYADSGIEWIDEDGTVPGAYPELKFIGVLSYAEQARVLEHAPIPIAGIMEKLKAGEPVTFELPVSLEATRRSEWKERVSPNVACVLPGSDPALADEYVLFSGHLDHLGKDEDAEGDDAIYNGFYDNATGIGIMLEVARAFAVLPEAPKRSVLFLAVTAEEYGLLGSEYWAANPTVPIDSVSANVNLDMPVLTFGMTDVIAYGAEHSELGGIVREQAAKQGFALSPDPWPEEVIFVRSDQYSFVKQGVPAVFLVPGWTAEDPDISGEKKMRGFEETHYHEVTDDASLPFDEDVAERFAATNFLIGLDVANRAAAVKWNAGDFFGERFAPEDKGVEVAP